MAKKKLGNKHVCYQCGCKFYDLSRPQPVCPKCGANQTEAPKKEPITIPKAVAVALASAPSRTRTRARRDEDEVLEPDGSFADDDGADEPLEDGLSMIDDDELIGASGEDFAEED